MELTTDHIQEHGDNWKVSECNAYPPKISQRKTWTKDTGKQFPP